MLVLYQKKYLIAVWRVLEIDSTSEPIYIKEKKELAKKCLLNLVI